MSHHFFIFFSLIFIAWIMKINRACVIEVSYKRRTVIYDLDELDNQEEEKKMFLKMFVLLRPFFAGCGDFPLDFTLLIDDAGVNFPEELSFKSWVIVTWVVGVGISSVSRVSGILCDPLLLSIDIALCWSFDRWAIRLCIDVMLVESKSELLNDLALLKLALSGQMS